MINLLKEVPIYKFNTYANEIRLIVSSGTHVTMDEIISSNLPSESIVPIVLNKAFLTNGHIQELNLIIIELAICSCKDTGYINAMRDCLCVLREFILGECTILDIVASRNDLKKYQNKMTLDHVEGRGNTGMMDSLDTGNALICATKPWPVNITDRILHISRFSCNAVRTNTSCTIEYAFQQQVRMIDLYLMNHSINNFCKLCGVDPCGVEECRKVIGTDCRYY